MMRFRGQGYRMTFHTTGHVTQVHLPEPPPDYPIDAERVASLHYDTARSIVLHALYVAEQHVWHRDGEGDEHCVVYTRATDLLDYVIELFPDLLVDPLVFRPAAPGTERAGR